MRAKSIQSFKRGNNPYDKLQLGGTIEEFFEWALTNPETWMTKLDPADWPEILIEWQNIPEKFHYFLNKNIQKRGHSFISNEYGHVIFGMDKEHDNPGYDYVRIGTEKWYDIWEKGQELKESTSFKRGEDPYDKLKVGTAISINRIDRHDLNDIMVLYYEGEKGFREHAEHSYNPWTEEDHQNTVRTFHALKHHLTFIDQGELPEPYRSNGLRLEDIPDALGDQIKGKYLYDPTYGDVWNFIISDVRFPRAESARIIYN